VQQYGNTSRWGVLIGITFLGVFLSASAQATVFTVNSASDGLDANPGNGQCETMAGNGICTLRAAIQEANALVGGDTIILPPNTYLLTQVTELTITGNLTITCSGASTTIIDGNNSARFDSGVLRIMSGAIVNISGVTIRNGERMTASGGGIANDGTLTLTGSAVSANTTKFGGGGIANDGTLTLTNTTVNGNTAIFEGGGIDNSGGTLTLNNSVVSGNTTKFGGGGISNATNFFEQGGTLTLNNSIVIDNGADLGGGGIDNVGGTLTLTNSTVSGNKTTQGEGGGVFNEGHIFAAGGTLTLAKSTVSGNTAFAGGGGIANLGTSTLTNSTVSGNTTGTIGGGGGIANSGTLTLTNSTVSGNTANFGGGGISNEGSANLFNVTITNNGASTILNRGGGGVVNGYNATFNFQNTILAGNYTFGVPNFTPSPECLGTINSNGNNLLGSLDCTVSGGGFTVGDPKLGPLQNNGGPTETHALLSGSPAIDGGNPGGCRDQFGALLTTDQRGLPRLADGNHDSVAACDIGAFELQAATGLVSAVLPSSRSVQVGVAATAFATVINSAQANAVGCSIAPPTSVPASFIYQTTDPATNQVTGSPNTPVDIPGGAAQSFVFAITPTATLTPTDVQFSFICTNTEPAPVNVGLNTLLLSASDTPVPDIVALAATTTNDGIVNIPGMNGTGAFAVATVNIGATGTITASADTGNAALPVNISLCQTDPTTGQCISAIGSDVTTTINANATPTFGIFVQGGDNVPFDPAVNRIFVRFRDGGGVTRGSTSVAVRTQ
jgi:CSLREA domain-containing protein